MKFKLLTISLLFSCSLIAQTKVISTIAGNGNQGFTGLGGLAVDAEVNQPWDIEVDSQGNVYFSDQGNHVVYYIDATTGIITNILGNGISGSGSIGELGPDYELKTPGYIYLDEANEVLYVSDYGNHKILKMNLSDSLVDVVVGNGNAGYSPDGVSASSAYIDTPMGLGIGSDGLLYFVDNDNFIIRKVDVNGTLFTVAGLAGTQGSLDGSLSFATVGETYDLEFGPNNALYFSQTDDGTIRKVDFNTDSVVTVCGTGTNGYNGDGNTGTATQFSIPEGIAFDSNGNLIISDNENHRIRKLNTSTNIVSTIVGTGNAGYSGDGGDPLLAEISGPIGIDISSNGDLYITEKDSHAVRKVYDCIDATEPSLLVVNNILDTSEICPGNYEIIVDGGDLNSADNWYWYTDSCGGSQVAIGMIHDHYLDTTITFYVRGEGGCTNDGPCGEITLTMSDCEDQDSSVVNQEDITAFTPNGDGVNDFLVIPMVENYPNNQVVIYNRWGDVIRRFQNYDNDMNSWKGNNQFGSIVEGGTYFYIFESDNIREANWVQVVK